MYQVRRVTASSGVICDYTSITFTTPDYENYYAFTIGEDDTATVVLTGGGGGTPTVPEPATLSLFGMGLAAIPLPAGLTRKP